MAENWALMYALKRYFRQNPIPIISSQKKIAESYGGGSWKLYFAIFSKTNVKTSLVIKSNVVLALLLVGYLEVPTEWVHPTCANAHNYMRSTLGR